MKTIGRIVAGLVACALESAAGGEEGSGRAHLRVAVAPPPSLESRASDGTVWAVAVSTWFQEALSGVKGVEVVSSDRSALIWEVVTSDAWIGADRDLWRAFGAHEWVDALVVVRPGTEGGKLTVWTSDGATPLTVERPGKERFRPAMIQAAEFLADRLGLDRDRRAPLVAVPELDGESLAILFSVPQTSASWPRNPGEAKILVLQPVWKKYPSDPRVCAEMLRAVAVQLASQRRDQSYTPTAIQIGRMALPPVLGTPFEDAALFLLRQAPSSFLPDLERAAGDLLKQTKDGKLGAALDAVLEGREEEEKKPLDPSAAWVSGRYSRVQQLGAVRLLARMETDTSRALIRQLANHPDPDVRKAAQPPEEAKSAGMTSLLSDSLSREELVRKAQDPEEGIAAEARRLLFAQDPRDPWEQRAWEIRIAHPLKREHLVDALAQDGSDRALMLLEATAADNPDPHVRAKALRLLAVRDSSTACRLAMAALNRRPGHRFERLQAAAVLMDRAGNAQADAIRGCLAAEPEPAVRDFLSVALARAEGRPLPPTGVPARKVGGPRNLAWLCGMGPDAERSPFDAYYLLSMPGDLERWRRVVEAGKIVFVRVTPIGHPGLAALSRLWRDRFWLALERELTPERVALLDGIVLGEETMTLAPEGLWEEGWRLFCAEEGLDPNHIHGDPEALSADEKQRWKNWAYEKSIAGFNRIVEYVRLRWQRERPGLQVCTFLPGEMGKTGPNIRQWQFDVAGIYDYKCDQRMAAFSLVRRLKTLWPDRPVIWLSLGIGGYEMNPVWYTHQTPSQPLTTRRIRAYADAVAAWLAGADTGWFSTWIFVAPRFQKGMSLAGVQVNLEDIFPGSPVLERALSHAFRGAAELEDLKTVKPPPAGQETPSFQDPGRSQALVDELADALEGRNPDAERRSSLEERQEGLRRGFQFYRHYLDECARVFRSLPRLAEKGAPALAVHPGVSVWTTPTTPNPLVPGHALLNWFDFADDERQMAETGADLSRYRMILVHDPGSWTGEVGTAVLRWLSTTEGILYLNRPGDMPTMPWTGDVVCRKTGRTGGRNLPALTLVDAEGNSLAVGGGVVGSLLTIRGEKCRVLLRRGDEPVLVLWRDPGRFRGTVILDAIESASKEYLEILRKILQTEGGASVAALLNGPILHSLRKVDDLTAAACSGYYRDSSDRMVYPGVDLLSGEVDPLVGGGLSATLAAKSFHRGHLHLEDGVLFLSENVLEGGNLERTSFGWRWSGRGLLRISRSGPIRVEPLEGPVLPLISAVEAGPWLTGREGRPGLLVIPPASGEGVTRVYVRSEKPLRIEGVGE